VNRTLLRRAAAVALVAAAVWFLGDAIVSNWAALREHEWRVDVPLLVASVVAHVAVLAWGVWVWGRVLRRFAGEPVPQSTLLRIWFLSNLARYIPGKVFQFLAVAGLARGAGLAPGRLLASLLVHTGLALLSASVVAAWTLAGALLPHLPTPAVGVLATAAAVLVVHPAVLNLALRTVSRVARRAVLRWEGGWGDGVALLLLSVVSWSFYGVAYYLFLAALTPLPLGTLPQLSGINALSFVAGYMALVTPGGLGVMLEELKDKLDDEIERLTHELQVTLPRRSRRRSSTATCARTPSTSRRSSGSSSCRRG
jgi:glycosyltransferase 2 family protein